jgi:predicted O-methyltransferase YrrM
MAEQNEELQAHLKRLNSELDASSSALGAITAERDKLKDHLEQLIREHLLLDPQKNPNFSYYFPGQFYSPIPSLEEVKKDEQRIFHEPRMIQGVDLNLEGQLQLLQSLTESFAVFPFQNDKIEKFRFSLGNPNFGGVDAVFLYAVIRHVKPRKVIEIGSGYSSALMLDMSDLYFEGETQFTFVEPYPELLRSILTEEDKKKVEIIPNRVQDVSLDKFSSLAEGDILFVDSSHVCKVGSDVNTLFFEILPSLASGVYIHIHDIFFPFEYPTEWIYEGRAWNEAYLLRAFLQYNPTFKIVLFNALVAKLYEEELKRSMPVNLDRTGGIWLMKC